jgi:hypothetical protein
MVYLDGGGEHGRQAGLQEKVLILSEFLVRQLDRIEYDNSELSVLNMG